MKLIFLLLIYIAGFATAVYILSPATAENFAEYSSEDNNGQFASSEQFTQTINAGMHKGVEIGKDFMSRLSILIKQKMNERKMATEQY